MSISKKVSGHGSVTITGNVGGAAFFFFGDGEHFFLGGKNILQSGPRVRSEVCVGFEFNVVKKFRGSAGKK